MAETSLGLAADELNKNAVFEYVGTTDINRLLGVDYFERGIAVEYDFDALSGNPYLKNLLIEATDSRLDRYGHVLNLCDNLREIEDDLASPAGK